jgi:hypothetical protein
MTGFNIRNRRIGAVAAAIAVAVAVAPAPALGRDLLFLGVADARGVAALPEFEGELRAAFAADRRFRLVGGVETGRVLREMERQGRSPAEGVIPKSAGLADSAVVAVAAVKELSVAPRRSSLLLWGRIDARMRVEVALWEVGGGASHRGEFSAAASKRKGVILFMDPRKGVHVSAADREEMLGEMRAKLVKDAVGLAAVFLNAVSAPAAPPPDSGGADAAADGDAAPTDSAGAEGGE